MALLAFDSHQQEGANTSEQGAENNPGRMAFNDNADAQEKQKDHK